MKKEGMSFMDSVIRILIGSMLVILLWFHTLGYIVFSESKELMLIILIIGVYSLLTGVAKTKPFVYFFKKMKK